MELCFGFHSCRFFPNGLDGFSETGFGTTWFSMDVTGWWFFGISIYSGFSQVLVWFYGRWIWKFYSSLGLDSLSF